MSGSALSFANRYANTSAAAWYSASSLLGCGDSSSGDAQVLTCMRTKSSTELIKVTEQVEASLLKTLEPDAAAYFGVIGAFGPTIDDVTVFENYTVLGNSANFIQRPVLIGSADDEGCLYAETGTIPVSAQDELTAVVFTCPIYHTTHARIAARLPTWTYRYFGVMLVSLRSVHSLTFIRSLPEYICRRMSWSSLARTRGLCHVRINTRGVRDCCHERRRRHGMVREYLLHNSSMLVLKRNLGTFDRHGLISRTTLRLVFVSALVGLSSLLLEETSWSLA